MAPPLRLQPLVSQAVSAERPSLAEWLERAPAYEAYTYGYPHKTSYRHFDTPHRLEDLWRDEDRSSLFLYLHVPFCEMRCGFCNLFTRAHTEGDLTARYVAAVERQARAVHAAIGEATVSRIAFGGGTPTFLTPDQLAYLFDLVESLFGARTQDLPTSLEVSPETATQEHLQNAVARGVDRISVGIQSFFDQELKALGRPLRGRAGEDALDRMRAANPPILNLDLIYGIDGQTTRSWLDSIEQALRWSPEELFLYPLYVRPLTGLGRRARSWEDQRLECYREGRALLLDRGYVQSSTRLFRRADAPVPAGPEYTCQEDGMIGLGCGARSYTTSVHYSDDWAVSAPEVKSILNGWVDRTAEDFSQAAYGVELDDYEQRTRYVLKSVLQVGGLSKAAYRARFGGEAASDWPELAALVTHGLLTEDEAGWTPTPFGLERGDQFGPWLYSAPVRTAMRGFQIR